MLWSQRLGSRSGYPEQNVRLSARADGQISVRRVPLSRTGSKTLNKRRLRARLHHGRQSDQVIALVATGQLGVAAADPPGRRQWLESGAGLRLDAAPVPLAMFLTKEPSRGVP